MLSAEGCQSGSVARASWGKRSGERPWRFVGGVLGRGARVAVLRLAEGRDGFLGGSRSI